MLTMYFKKDNLGVKIYDSRKCMGEGAAADAAAYIGSLLSGREHVNIIFAAAPSQNEFLEALLQKDIDWGMVNAFHMDEYIGLPGDAPQGFGNYLRRAIFERAPFRSVHYIDGQAAPEEACSRYSELLKEYPADIVFMGIGENGHIAFNDPHVADFMDTRIMKVVDLDEKCRMQQVHDGCFHSIAEVPSFALTLTVPALMSAGRIFCIVPSGTKSAAVRAALYGDISESCPASILRTKPEATLYLDKDSSRLLDMESLKLS